MEIQEDRGHTADSRKCFAASPVYFCGEREHAIKWIQ